MNDLILDGVEEIEERGAFIIKVPRKFQFQIQVELFTTIWYSTNKKDIFQRHVETKLKDRNHLLAIDKIFNAPVFWIFPYTYKFPFNE